MRDTYSTVRGLKPLLLTTSAYMIVGTKATVPEFRRLRRHVTGVGTLAPRRRHQPHTRPNEKRHVLRPSAAALSVTSLLAGQPNLDACVLRGCGPADSQIETRSPSATRQRAEPRLKSESHTLGAAND